MKKANFGCGVKIFEGFENFDKYPINNKVKYLDLNVLPLPFKDNYWDFILMDNVFEHLTVCKMSLMKELFRILKENRILKIIVPCNMDIVTHEKGYFPKKYFSPLNYKSHLNVDYVKTHGNKIAYNTCTFEIKIDHVWYNYKKWVIPYTRYLLFKYIPLLRWLFPHLTNGVYIYTLTKKTIKRKKIWK
jgi:ubiquinone/menaquinone biosynthesis C-methylase UbiE